MMTGIAAVGVATAESVESVESVQWIGDRASQLAREPEDLYVDLLRRLDGEYDKRNRREPACVHVCPQDTNIVPDDPVAGLVILRPEHITHANVRILRHARPRPISRNAHRPSWFSTRRCFPRSAASAGA